MRADSRFASQMPAGAALRIVEIFRWASLSVTCFFRSPPSNLRLLPHLFTAAWSVRMRLTETGAGEAKLRLGDNILDRGVRRDYEQDREQEQISKAHRFSPGTTACHAISLIISEKSQFSAPSAQYSSLCNIVTQ